MTFSSQGDALKYHGPMDIEHLSEWVLRKIGLPDNRIRDFGHLQDKLHTSRLLVVFISYERQADLEFNIYLAAARHLLKLSEVEFAFMYFDNISAEMPDISTILSSDTFKRFKFQIRVFRRGNLSDFKDLATAESAVN